jgi:NAD/NADP transhydrogenase alpha subunit
MPGYMSVYSWVSPAMEAFRLSLVPPIGRPVAGIAGGLEVFEVAVGVAGLALGGGAENGRDVVVALDIGLVREVEVAAVGLRFAGEGGFQATFGLGCP